MTRRVLLVHGGSDLYGSGLACAWLIEAAVAEGWDVEAVLPRAGPLSERLTALGVACHWIDPVPLRAADLSRPTGILQPVRWLPDAKKLWRLAGRGGFDLVHANTAPALGALLTTARSRIPLIWSIHEILRLPGAARRGYEALLRRADAVTACSQSAAAQFVDPRIRTMTEVVYTGARIVRPAQLLPPLEHNRIRLIVIGRLTWWKGHDVVVRCLPLL